MLYYHQNLLDVVHCQNAASKLKKKMKIAKRACSLEFWAKYTRVCDVHAAETCVRVTQKSVATDTLVNE